MNAAINPAPKDVVQTVRGKASAGPMPRVKEIVALARLDHRRDVVKVARARTAPVPAKVNVANAHRDHQKAGARMARPAKLRVLVKANAAISAPKIAAKPDAAPINATAARASLAAHLDHRAKTPDRVREIAAKDRDRVLTSAVRVGRVLTVPDRASRKHGTVRPCRRADLKAGARMIVDHANMRTITIATASSAVKVATIVTAHVRTIAAWSSRAWAHRCHHRASNRETIAAPAPGPISAGRAHRCRRLSLVRAINAEGSPGIRTSVTARVADPSRAAMAGAISARRYPDRIVATTEGRGLNRANAAITNHAAVAVKAPIILVDRAPALKAARPDRQLPSSNETPARLSLYRCADCLCVCAGALETRTTTASTGREWPGTGGAPAAATG